MKKTICMLVCLALVFSFFNTSVMASDEKMVYYSLIEAGRAESSLISVEGDLNVKSIDANEGKNYLTVTPEEGVVGEVNTWGSQVAKLRIKLAGAQNVDYSSDYDNLYIKVKIKSTVVPKRLWTRTNKNNGGGWSTIISGMTASTESDDNWYEILIAFSSVIKDDKGNKVTEFKDLYIGFGYAEGVTVEAVDIAEISIVGPDVRKKPELVKSGMNEDGKYQVVLEYESPLGLSAETSNYYKIGEISAESVSIVGNKATLMFDMMPDFPGDVVLTISENATCSDGYPLYPEIKISNMVTYVATVKDGCVIEVRDGSASFSGSIGCIYDKTGEGISITALIVVYDESNENAFVTYGVSETKNVMYKGFDNFTVTAEDEKIKAGMTARLFIIDSLSSGRPLAPVK